MVGDGEPLDKKTRRLTKTGGRPATKGVIRGNFSLSVGMPDSLTPQGWRWTALCDVARLETGHTPSRRHPEYWGGDVPWIGIKDATENHGRVIFDTHQHTNELGIANSSARILPVNTVCLSRTASVGYVVVMGRPMATSQDFVNWVCSDAIDYRFLKYILLAENAAFSRFSSGTTHQTIYFPEAKAFHVALPPLSEQRAIAHLLGTLDDKIELNRRMNATLEAMARALFQAWFVDDPDADWEEKPLDEIAEYLNGLALQKYPVEEGEAFLPVIKIAQLRKQHTEDADRASAAIDPAYIVNDGDVLFSWSGSLEVVLWCGGRGALNQHLFKVTSADYPKWFYYLWTRHHLPEFQQIAAGKATTMGHIQRHHLSAATVRVPPRPILDDMTRQMAPILDRIIVNAVQSRTLASLRDSLLPKLISGELRVKDKL